MNLNGTERLVEMDWKNYEKDRSSFGTVLKIWHENTWGEAAFLESLKAAIIFQRFPCTLRKLILQENLWRYIQKYSFLV